MNFNKTIRILTKQTLNKKFKNEKYTGIGTIFNYKICVLRIWNSMSDPDKIRPDPKHRSPTNFNFLNIVVKRLLTDISFNLLLLTEKLYSVFKMCPSRG